jgi:hypothetical protein
MLVQRGVEFVALILGIAMRLVFSTLVQVLAASAATDSVDSLIAKIVTLSSLATYFVWVGSAANIQLV